jgi:hypothetical protein
VSLWQRAMFPGAVSAALLLALFLHWPSLASGFRSDDYVQSAMVRGAFPVPRSALDLFDFASGTQDEYRRLTDFGYLPWWTNPQLRLRMWRPLSSALMALDFKLFGTQAGAMHWHSLGWLVVLLLAAAWLLSRTLPPAAASIAILLYATSPCHAVPVGWLANRSTLLAGALGFLAVDLQLRYRAAPSKLLFAITAVVTSLALLAGEYALSALAYAFAFAALGGGELALRARLRSVSPVLIPLAAYLVLHTLSGSDVIGSGFYLSPVRDPWLFVQALVTRVPALAADLLFGVPSLYFSGSPPLRNMILSWNLFSPEVWLSFPAWRVWHVLIGYFAIALGGGLIWRFVRRTERSHPLRWLSAGAALSLLPCAGSLPEDRLLSASTLGVSALCASALLLGLPWVRKAASKRTRLLRALLYGLLLWLPVGALRRSFAEAQALSQSAESTRLWSLDADLPTQASATTRVYVLAAGDFNTAVNLPWLRQLHGRPLPQAYRRLCPGPLPVDVTRSADRTLEINVLTNAMRGTALPSLYRAADAPMHVGDQVELPGLRVDVLGVFEDNPSRVRFTFDRSIDDPTLWFLIAGNDGLRHQAMPALHETRRVPYAQFRDLRAQQPSRPRADNTQQ